MIKSVYSSLTLSRWPQLVPMFKDDPVTVHMENARNCLKTWRKPALVMFGDRFLNIYCLFCHIPQFQ